MIEARFDTAANRAAFIEEWRAGTKPLHGQAERHPTRFFIVDTLDDFAVVVLEVQEFDGRVWLDFIGVPREYRRTGLATKALTWLCELADRHGVLLHLTVCPPPRQRERGAGFRVLNRWYRRFGFKPWRSGNGRRRYPSTIDGA